MCRFSTIFTSSLLELEQLGALKHLPLSSVSFSASPYIDSSDTFSLNFKASCCPQNKDQGKSLYKSDWAFLFYPLITFFIKNRIPAHTSFWFCLFLCPSASSPSWPTPNYLARPGTRAITSTDYLVWLLFPFCAPERSICTFVMEFIK